jgi:hypothetical protein
MCDLLRYIRSRIWFLRRPLGEDIAGKALESPPAWVAKRSWSLELAGQPVTQDYRTTHFGSIVSRHDRDGVEDWG